MKDKIKEQPANEVKTAEVKHKKTDALHRKREEDYQTLLDTIPHGIQEIDTSGNIVYVNKAYNRMYGCEEGEVLGTSILDKLPHDPEREKLRDYLKILVEDQPTPTPFFETNRTKEGRIIDVQVDWNYKRDKKGHLVGFISVVTDITERKQAEEALKESEEKYYNLIEHANDAIVSINRDGMIIGFNKKAEEMFGYYREEVLEKSAYLLAPLEKRDNQKKIFEQHTEKRRIDKKVIEGMGLRKNGQEFFSEFSFYTLDLHGESITTSIIRDISERKMAEQKLIDYQNRLKALTAELTLTEEKERRSFADYLHDQIGQQLCGLKLKVESLQSDISSTPASETLNNSLIIIEQIIQEIRFLTIELSPPILYQLGLEAALEWLSEKIHEQYGVIVTFEDDGKDKPIEDDVKILLFRAVRELLVNVAKHAQVQNAKVSIGRDDCHIRICVHDEGVGFDLLDRKSSNRENQGYGLFNITERLDQLGGHLKIESQPNRGTHLTIVAPLSSSGEEL
jgi:PAS domain S-box-containing protein